MLVGKPQLCNRISDFFGNPGSTAQLRFRKDKRKLLAAVACGKIRRAPAAGAYCGGNLSEALIACLMAVVIVVESSTSSIFMI